MKIYKSYMFRNKDPVIDRLRTLIADEGVTYSDIQKHSGVTTGTLRNWFKGPTKRPQFASTAAVARALGYEIEFVRMKGNNVVQLRRKA